MTSVSEKRPVGRSNKYKPDLVSKVCFTCALEKSISEFHKDNRSSSGYQTKCKNCLKQYYKTNEERYKKLRTGNKKYAHNMKIYFEKNKHKINNYKRSRYSTEDGYLKIMAVNSKRRALKISSSDGTITAKSLKALLMKQDYKCAISGKFLDKYDLDHINPLSKGGAHSIHNVQFVLPSINRSKKDKIYASW